MLYTKGEFGHLSLLGTMRVITWNYHGLRNPQAIPALHLLSRQEKPNILCLIKTKLSIVDFAKMEACSSFCLGVSSEGRRGSLGILQKEGIGVSIRRYNRHFIDYIIEDEEQHTQ